ncbi:MAG: acetyl-CoA carboxylase biotin carboxylase subunit [Nitrospira sp.]|nr:acetyl-CoA carboxylase biotin carboxylase subunit [Nitrospira sp.]MCY4131097.1 acetyl-CoA carboxylase biotin carboxylase subunit [Nitrospira sp.]
MLKKILVANRGEIAMRVIRACRELNIATAAIYAECEATAIYVKKANEAYLVGPGPVQGFLDAQQIVNLAKRIEADAIHPGYGFLAENAQFAHLCREAGITFIGPSPEALELLGDKVRARELAKQTGIPVVPGTDGRVESVEEGLSFAQSVGYPVMVKASAGGGGRGLRVVRSNGELKEAMESGAREALAAFGNADLFLEKYIERPHHIEFQLLADSEDHVVHLGERDCSIQRRHQKMIEIAPSLILTPQLRGQMGDAAVALARAAEFENAGTIEFLLDQHGNYYFMEMNPRIQVEHTVTEQITTIDIVQTQIWIAAGRPLVFGQHEVNLQGYAIQCRINAEDPQNGFRPSSGKVTAYLSPGGIGVRIDGAVYKDYTVPPYYDALLAKMTVQGRTWDETVRRTNRSLEEFLLRGVKTNIPFLKNIMEEPDFLSGKFDTSYLDSHPDLYNYDHALVSEDLVVTLSAAIAAYEGL